MVIGRIIGSFIWYLNYFLKSEKVAVRTEEELCLTAMKANAFFFYMLIYLFIYIYIIFFCLYSCTFIYSFSLNTKVYTVRASIESHRAMLQ